MVLVLSIGLPLLLGVVVDVGLGTMPAATLIAGLVSIPLAAVIVGRVTLLEFDLLIRQVAPDNNLDASETASAPLTKSGT